MKILNLLDKEQRCEVEEESKNIDKYINDSCKIREFWDTFSLQGLHMHTPGLGVIITLLLSYW